MKPISYEAYQEKVKNLKTLGDVTSFAKELIAPTLQEMLNAEMDNHLGYPKNHIAGNNTGNSRNGYSKKKIKTSFGEQEIKVPRDRNGKYDPIAVKKYETVESDVEEKIISMYAKGMTTSDINSHMRDIYGVNISSTMISNITDKIMPLVKEWQNRPLDDMYTIVYLDAIHFKVRESGKIINKAAYVVLAINIDGKKELLGIWIGENEGAKYWLRILNELKSRGLKDILICCVDGLKGFSDAIKTIYPETEIQKCVIHQIRNTIKYIPHKHKREFCKDLKDVYKAINAEEALDALQKMKEKWPKYAIYLKSWEKNWEELSLFYAYPEEIRRIIYTNNTIESLNRQFRKVTKTSSIFPHDDSLLKLLWLAQNDIARKWTKPIRNWGEIIAQLAIFFPNRVKL